MPAWIIKHVLPDGSVAGYHADSFCSIADSPGDAKIAVNNNAEEWLKIVRKNFEFNWNDEEVGPGYRSFEIWKGHNLEEIKTVLEEVPVPEHRCLRIIPI